MQISSYGRSHNIDGEANLASFAEHWLPQKRAGFVLTKHDNFDETFLSLVARAMAKILIRHDKPHDTPIKCTTASVKSSPRVLAAIWAGILLFLSKVLRSA